MEFEDYIGNVLRVGVIISMLLILAGFLLIWLSPQNGNSGNISALAGFSTLGLSAADFVTGIASGAGIYYIMLGLVVLLATPVVRVLLSVIWFALEKNPLYTVITLIVLLNLLLAIFVIPRLVGIY